MKNCRICWLLCLVLAIALGAMAYLFVIRGDVAKSEDGRTAILLKGAERDFILGEMREFLEGVQEITGAIGEGDMKTIVEVGTKLGSEAVGGVPVAIMSKLPIDFKSLGVDTHGLFDKVAATAKETDDPKILSSAVSELLGNCTTCHSGYRLGVE